MQFIIEEQLAQAILNFLGTCPYKDVFPLVGELMKLKPIEVKKEE